MAVLKASRLSRQSRSLPFLHLDKASQSFTNELVFKDEKLDDCKFLPNVFKRRGLEKIESKVAGTDSDFRTRAECSHTMLVTFDRLLIKFVNVPGSGKCTSCWITNFLF